MSHSILLVVPIPDEKNEVACRLWHNILSGDIAQTASKYKGIQILGRNVLLIDVDENLNGLSKVVSLLRSNDAGETLSYRYLILDEEMKWHEVAKNP